MSRIIKEKREPELDMNPVVDVAFLLLIFFILTTTLKKFEPVEVENPTSFADQKLPEKDLMVITVSQDGRLFLSFDDPKVRSSVFQKMSDANGLSVSSNEIQQFSATDMFGMPLNTLPTFLNLGRKDRIGFEQVGIPCDSSNNELYDWIKTARATNPKLRAAINSDVDTPYRHIQIAIDALRDNFITRFSFITYSKAEDVQL